MKNRIDHWTSELPEFGTPLTIANLVNERDEITDEISRMRNRLAHIETEIYGLVSRQWSRDEIVAAQESYGRSEDKNIFKGR